MTPYQKAGFNELSLFRVSERDAREERHGQIVWLRRDDKSSSPYFASTHSNHQCYKIRNLDELPKYSDGYYLWEGGQCPVPGDWVVSARCDDAKWTEWRADDIGNEWRGITAFKPISRPDIASTKYEVDHAPTAESPLNDQEGGNHYKDMAIQPVEYIHANGLGFCEGAIIKYVSRWRAKNGIDDLKKARHFIDLLIELEGWK